MASIPLVDLRAQYLTLREEIDAAIARVISRSAFVQGEEVEAFEEEFARYCGAAHCVACGNGTDALELALRAVGVGPGDEVITVAHTFAATGEAIVNVGARPVFVDVRPDTLLMDPAAVEAAVGPATRAVMPVHLYGQPVDLDPLLALAERKGLVVIEDAAQAHGARHRGRRAGAMGHLGCFSFYPGKNLGAYGDAGAVLARDGVHADWLRRARDHGRSRKYEHAFVGRNSRMDGLQGAVLRVKLGHLDAWNAARRRLAERYDAAFAATEVFRPVEIAPEVESARHLYVLRAPARQELQARLRVAGVDSGIHYPIPLHRQPAFAAFGDGVSLPVTERACEEIVSLPLYPELPEAEVDRIVRLVRG